jgi:hypothetical protein
MVFVGRDSGIRFLDNTQGKSLTLTDDSHRLSPPNFEAGSFQYGLASKRLVNIPQLQKHIVVPPTR